MLSKIWLINFILLPIVMFFGFKTCNVWFDKSGNEFKPKKIEISKRSNIKMKVHKVPPESFYGVIAEKDLFTQARTEFVPEEMGMSLEDIPLKIAGKKIVLYGVVLADDYKKALISNPARKSTPDWKRNIWVQIGDTIDKLKVIDIQENCIYLTESEKLFNIPLYNKNNPKRRANVSKKLKPSIITSRDKTKQTRTTAKSSKKSYKTLLKENKKKRQMITK